MNRSHLRFSLLAASTSLLALACGGPGDSDAGPLPDGAGLDAGPPPDGAPDASSTPVDECAEGTDDCHPSATCTDLEVGFECECPAGTIGDGRACAAPIEVALAADDWHTCHLAEGVARCWGVNSDGQLGDGSQELRTAPVAVRGGHRFSRIATNALGFARGRACGVTVDGALYCWGDVRGFVDDPGAFLELEPRRIGAELGWSDITVRSSFVCGVRDGALYCWGQGWTGEPTPIMSSTPVRIGEASDWTAVRSSDLHTCALREDGSAHCFGQNLGGQLGDGGTQGHPEPMPVAGDGRYAQLALEGSSTCAVTTDGALECWGVGPAHARSLTPARVGAGSDWVGVALGVGLGCAVRADGELWCAGRLVGGRALPDSELSRVETPEPVVDAAIGFEHACAASASGRVFCWGENDFGQLGYGAAENTDAPVRVADLAEGVTAFATGEDGSCARVGEATRCWGGALFQETPGLPLRWVLAPTEIPGAGSLEALAMDRQHHCGLAGGELLCWGGNAGGQLGHSPGVPVVVEPAPVPGSGWTSVAVGLTHTCGIRVGELYCWGHGREGQLGVPPPAANVEAPMRVGADSDWTRVDAQWNRTCGLRGAGEVYCFGDDAVAGEMTTPTRVGADTWAQLSVGTEHACLIDDGGGLSCWGRGFYLGGGQTQRDSETPIPVGETSGWLAVDAGRTWSCGLRAPGTLHCWSGEAPEQVGTRDDWVDVRVAGSHACALDAAGALHCFGQSDDGALGIGHAWRTEPVDVDFGGG